MHRRTFILSGLLCSPLLHAQPPGLMLANRYRTGIDPSAYWISEKLDGVRAYWDGAKLFTRKGYPINTPPGFTDHFPATPIDGELWSGRQQFQRVATALQLSIPEPAAWHKIQFCAFDLPNSHEPFTLRTQRLKALVADTRTPQLQYVDQFRVQNEGQLRDVLAHVVAQNGEGLMLHHGDSLYLKQRSDNLLKLKLHQDAEATVIAHLPGQGKYQHKLGSLLVESDNGRRFRLGSGFSNAERSNPPPLGSRVTYRYYGQTSQGLPRFASFQRMSME